jgi:hypothetical protein
MSWEVYQEAGRARTGVFCSFWTSGAVVVVPKKFLRKDIVYKDILITGVIKKRPECFKSV